MTEKETLRQDIKQAQKVLIGIGQEWKKEHEPEVKTAYESLYQLVDGTDYFIVTTVTDAAIFDTALEAKRIVAPCGNENWRQCSAACTKDIWEVGELAEEICPHCGAPLTGNTIAAETYIEEGYLPQWQAYMTWLTGTLNKDLVLLELGVGFQVPTVIRWPFEKTTFFNKKAHLYRINETFAQVSEEIKDKMTAISEKSLDYLRGL